MVKGEAPVGSPLTLPATFWTASPSQAAILLVRENLRLPGDAQVSLTLAADTAMEVPAEGSATLGSGGADAATEEDLLLLRWSARGAWLSSTRAERAGGPSFSLEAAGVRQWIAVTRCLAAAQIAFPPRVSDEPTRVIVNREAMKLVFRAQGGPAAWAYQVEGPLFPYRVDHWQQYLGFDRAASLRVTLLHVLWRQALPQLALGSQAETVEMRRALDRLAPAL